MYVGIELIKDKLLTVGELIAVITVTLSLQAPLTKLSLTNVHISEIQVAFSRIYEIVNVNTLEKGKVKFFEPISVIQFKNVSFGYPGAPKLFKNISLSFKPHTINTIIGPSGCGKSSLLNLLKKEFETTEGNILINNGINLNDIECKDWLAKTGIVNQEPLMFNATLLENIAFSFDLTSEEKNEVIELSQKLGFHRYFMSLPMNYLTMIDENGRNLSGGQKQLIALVRAIYRKPEVLILDEPTSSLDVKTEQFVISLLSKIKTQMTVIAVSHRKEILKVSDQILTLGKAIPSKAKAHPI
jgi:ATP-binding cassette subfamily B protein